MKPDKLDIKIQEAAAQNEAAYDEQAWSAMEKLLDEKMPQKKKDNKKLFWWFLLLCILISGLWLTLRPGENRKVTMASIKATEADTLANGSDNISKNEKISANQNENGNIVSLEKIPEPQPKKSFSGKKPGNTFSINFTDKKFVDERKINSSNQNPTAKIENNFNDNAHSVDKIKHADITNEPKSVIEETQPDKADSNKNITAIVKEKNDSIINKKNAPGPAKKTKDSAGNKFRKSFLISVSAGPDISAVSVDNPGKTELVYGAGIGYKINKRWTVRTGFYIVKKGYDAKSSDYHPPAGFWNYYPYLKSIDANCKIYEVPLSVNYNFSQNAKHLWFVSAGLSSYFMKKEDYSYISKSPSGQISYNDYTVRNQNQHYFSSVRLSAGYEKKVSNKISIIAEPYFNLPLSGIGYGKVKLHSAGILFSLDIKPFSKNNQPSVSKK